MPALKMKTKSSMICSREGNGLGVCSKSSIISKNSCSQVRISQQAVSLESSIQSDQDLSSKVEVSARENECDAVDHQEFFDGEPCQFQKPPLSAADSSSVGRMEFLPATWPSNLETIFSPIFESIEVHCKPDIYNYAVGNVAHLKANDNNDGSSISCDYQTCNVSDFYISDMTVVDEIMEANLFSDYECIHHDMTEKNMTLPFLEETVETRNTHDAKSCEEAIMNSDDACLHLAIQQIKSCDQESELSSLFFDPDEADYFDPHLFIKNLPGPSDVVPSFRPILLPKEAQKRKSITLVLDLDETLVHSSLDHAVDADFTFPVFFNMKEHIVYVRQRPYLHAFLERVAEMFEIIIFTASQSIYAEQLLNILDPERKLISQRAYRESCIFSDGSYIKDLTVLGVDLAKVAIIDNTPQVYQLQVNNGIPIKSWFDDPSDRALISLLPFLETLVDVDDVRPIIAKGYSKE